MNAIVPNVFADLGKPSMQAFMSRVTIASS